MPDIDVTGYDNPATPADEGTTDVNGLIIVHPTGGVVSGTGGFQPFLRQNNNDGETQGFNTSDATTLADADDEGLDMDATWTRAVQFGNLPIVIRDGVAYYEIRLDLNEENNAGTDDGGDPNRELELSELQLYWSHQQATLADYTAGDGLVLDSDFHNVYDLDSGGVDRSLILIDGPSGSGNDDYAFYIPVDAFADAGPDDYLTLFAQFGPQPQEGATFEEFRLQNAFRITGTKFLDVNGDGSRDINGVDNILGNGDDEVGLAGFTMYIDANNNNVLDVGEVTSLSGAGGSFGFFNLLAGTYSVREVLTEDDISAALKIANPDWEDDYLPPDGFWDQTTGNLDGDHVVTITTASLSVLVGNDELVPSISIVKEVRDVDGDTTSPVVDAAGDVVNYTIAITNTGDITLTGLLTEDQVEALAETSLTPVESGGFNTGDTNTNDAFDPGETWNFTAAYTVTQDDIDNYGGGDGILDNIARATTDQTAEVEDPAEVPIVQEPEIQVVKEASVPGDCANVLGETITYTYSVTNEGNVSLENIDLVDDFSDGAPVGVDLDTDGFNDGDLDEDGELDVDETWTYTAYHVVTQDDIDDNGNFDSSDPPDGINDVIRNVATVTGEAVTTGTEVSDDDDATVAVCQEPSIDIEKYVRTDINGTFVDADDPDGSQASTSSTVDFKIVLTNDGNVTLTNVTLSDSVVHTVGGVPGAPVAIDYSDPALGVFIDLDGDATLDVGVEEWSNFDTDGDGTLDIDENGDPFELSVGETVEIYYSLTSAVGQHENTVEVTADATTTGEDATDEDDANYYVLPDEDCVGVRTPGFWQNTKWMTFWDGIGDGWGTAPNEPHQAGSPGFADGELLYGVDSDENGVINHVAGDGSNDGSPLDAKGLLIGDYNLNGITDAGEDTLFIAYADAVKLINASSKQLVEGKGTADGIFMLGRDMVATWLNYLANNQETIGECIGDVSGVTNTPREYLDAAIDWMQQFASDQNSASNGTNQNTSFHDGNTQATFQFDARVNPSSTAWQIPFGPGEDIPVSGAAMHAALDAYNNTGAIGGIEYCCDADSEVVLSVLAQVNLV